jgi:monofunctional glycosyltransferase
VRHESKGQGRSQKPAKGKSKAGQRPRKWRWLSWAFLKGLHWVRQGVLIFVGFTVALTLLYRFVPPPVTPLMILRLADLWLDRMPVRMEKKWTPLDQMTPALPSAVIASEDQLFFEHHGFDFEAIVSAVQQNREGRAKIGASTITQQTAKNLFLWPERSWARKGLEVYFTLLLELLWSKERILEVYLNVAETGPGLYGMPMAAKTYYHTSPKSLSREQAALLAACLPNPLKWNPNRHPNRVARRQQWILRQMNYQGPLPL